ncbi:MAG: HAD-IA family hydrolase [Chloroflexota bacterium]
MLHWKGMPYRAVFFDFMGTLARFVPEQEELLVTAAAASGVTLSLRAARQGFAAGGDWWVRQLGRVPLALRSHSEMEALYRGFDVRVLQAAGVRLSVDRAFGIFQELLRIGSGSRLSPYGDVAPALAKLRDQGVVTGVLSNMGRDLPDTLEALGIATLFEVVVSSAEAGAAKPDPGIFAYALRKAAVTSEVAIHVGDQFDNDVLGARRAGVTPVLVDRYDLAPDRGECAKVRSLLEVPLLLG